MEEVDYTFRKNVVRTHPGGLSARTSPRDSASAENAASTDAALLDLIARGEEPAMATLFDRYCRVVYSVSLRVLRDPAAAEDVLQDVFLQIWRRPDTMAASRGSFGAWLSVVARNRSIDAIRRRKPSDAADDVVFTSSSGPAGALEGNAVMERERLVIAGLPLEQRKSLEMAFFDGLTHSEIAETTGDAPGTVKTRIRTALLVLRKAMQS